MKRFLAPISVALGFLGVLLAGFLVSASAASTVTPDDGNLLDLARPVFDEVMKGNYIAAASLALVLCVALARRYAPGKAGTFVHSDAGGALTTLLMAFGGALATATMGGAPWTWAMGWTAATLAVTAAGGYTLVKKLAVDPLLKSEWYNTKAPIWFKTIMGVVLWIFIKKDAETVATDAGNTAVAAKPSTGLPTGTDL